MQTTVKHYNNCTASAASARSCRPTLLQALQKPASPAAALRKAARRQQRQQHVCAAAEVAASAAPATGEEEFYEVFLDKPLGIKFGRGTKDGAAYVIRSEDRLGNTSPLITPGDKVVKVSASFGSDIWDALNYGQTVYAIKTRSGQIYMKLKKNYGDMSALEPEELSEAELAFKAERSGGNYGYGTKEVQARNYAARQEADRSRRAMFDGALQKFKSGKVEEALIDFENVLGLEPKNYLGDDFSRVTDVYRVTQYNIACCYAALDQIDNALDSLDNAMAAGFDNFDKVRSDPNLAKVRAEKAAFKAVIDKYDEPIINEEALNAIKNLFSFGKKN